MTINISPLYLQGKRRVCFHLMIAHVFWSLLLFIALLPVGRCELCISKNDEPPFHPNIYTCNETSTCCESFDERGCCSQEVTFNFFFKFIEFIPYLVGSFFVVIMACSNMTDPDPFDPHATLKSEKEEYMHIREKQTDDNRVGDPLFGPVMWDVAPTYASYDEQQMLEKRWKSIYNDGKEPVDTFL
ncbi:hypothetical protein QR680_003272 [Steinernema hermaphroditum]|uniref:Uncharacterized protein n=1 Tax=Steinernema hermaphroditum TaxID=289476 RepID=A0AA39LJD8_9BILA|nr:hypothetical protein QR680_003272 [Steinernema hermaphroditum]